MLSADTVRSIFREEGCASASPTRTTNVKREAGPAPSLIDPQALEDATAIVDRALATGVWGEADASAFRRSLAGLTAQERDDLLKKLLPAVNAQQIKVTVRGPLF